MMYFLSRVWYALLNAHETKLEHSCSVKITGTFLISYMWHISSSHIKEV